MPCKDERNRSRYGESEEAKKGRIRTGQHLPQSPEAYTYVLILVLGVSDVRNDQGQTAEGPDRPTIRDPPVRTETFGHSPWVTRSLI
jgi:hypothetical protein